MARRINPQRTSAAIAELQAALDKQEAAEKLVANKLAKLARLLSDAESEASRKSRPRKAGPILVVSNDEVTAADIAAQARSG